METKEIKRNRGPFVDELKRLIRVVQNNYMSSAQADGKKRKGERKNDEDKTDILESLYSTVISYVAEQTKLAFDQGDNEWKEDAKLAIEKAMANAFFSDWLVRKLIDTVQTAWGNREAIHREMVRRIREGAKYIKRNGESLFERS